MNKDSISSKLQELFELFKSGIITEEEYKVFKSKLTGIQSTEYIDYELISRIKEGTTL